MSNVAITQIDPVATSEAVVHYLVTFEGPTAGVTASSFALTSAGISGASISSVTSVASSGGRQYVVTVTTGAGSGSLTLNLSSNFVFASHPTTSGFTPTMGQIGDVNGDGKADVILPNYRSGNVAVLLGNGDGTFASTVTFQSTANSFGDTSNYARLGDFNGDGKLDIVTTNYAEQSLSVLLGNGDGSFQSRITTSLGSPGDSPFVADVDRDGKQDVLMLHSSGVAFLKGSGAGTFAAPQFIGSSGASSFAYSDITRDGQPDLVIKYASAVQVYAGNGGGSFALSTTIALSAPTVSQSTIVADADGNGYADILFNDYSNSRLGVILNGAAGYSAASYYSMGGTNPINMTVADANGDGKLDAIAVGETATTILYGNGSGAFGNLTLLSTGFATRGTFGDLNGDGDTDIVTANFFNNEVNVLLNVSGAGATYTIDKAPPVISSNGGGDTASFGVIENNKTVTTVQASDANGSTVLYSIVGGDDASLFAINTSTGALNFISAGNYEAPGDANHDNIYQVTVRATDGVNNDDQAISVTVQNMVDSAELTGPVYPAPNNNTFAGSGTPTRDGGQNRTYGGFSGIDNVYWGLDGVKAAMDGFADSPAENLSLQSISANGLIATYVGTTTAPGYGGTIYTKLEVTINASQSGTAHWITNASLGYASGPFAVLDVDEAVGSFAVNVSWQASTSATGPYDSFLDLYDAVSTGNNTGVTSSSGVFYARVLNYSPVISSNGGGATASTSVAENDTAVTIVEATDPDAGNAVSYSIAGGSDANLFEINTTTGALVFRTAPDYENAADANGDNVYEVTVRASDGMANDDQSLSVTVTDIIEGDENPNTLYGTPAPDTILGFGGNDFLVGRGGNDRIEGGNGHDYLEGGDGDDTLFGNDGDDLLYGGLDNDLIDGGAGWDRAGFSFLSNSGVTVDLTLQGTPQNTGQGMDTLVSIENVSGTRFNDVITGDGGDNWLWGGTDGSGTTGNDAISGGGGNDLIEVGTGNHTLNGGAGADTLTLWGNSTDITSAGVTVSLALQGAPQDTEQGMMTVSGFENLSGSRYDDNLTGDGGANILAGVLGNDVLVGGGGNDTLYGDGDINADSHGTGYSGPIATTIANTPGGNDTLEGGLGNDLLDGGFGSDTANYANAAGAVTVRLFAGIASGADGNDTLVSIENATGSAYDDTLVGDTGNNVLKGGAGSDFLVGAQGNDVLDGGTGVLDYATFYYAPGTVGSYSIRAGAGADAGKLFVMLTNGSVSAAVAEITTVADGTITVTGVGAGAGLGTDTLTNVDRLLFSTVSSDPFTIPTMPGFVVMDVKAGTSVIGDVRSDLGLGTSGADTLTGGDAVDALFGFGGDDLLRGGIGNDLLDGGAGNDTASYSTATGAVSLNVGTGTATGADGTDTLVAIENAIGSAYADTLMGSSGANALNGGSGNDRIVGNGGSDRLTGGLGADTFGFRSIGDSPISAPVVITDFSGAVILSTNSKGRETRSVGQGDSIDLSAIDANINIGGDQAFTIVRNSFTGTAGEMYASYNAGTATTSILLDVNGDAVADMAIALMGQINITGADLIL